MKLLTKNTDYAVRALLTLALAPKGEFVPSSAIAGAQAIPLPFLRRILHTLLEAGFVEAQEGKGGGTRLARTPDRISVGELIRVFQGPVEISQCLFRRRFCRNRSTCVLRHRLKGIEARLADEFESITIKNLLDDLKRGGNAQKNNKN